MEKPRVLIVKKGPWARLQADTLNGSYRDELTFLAASSAEEAREIHNQTPIDIIVSGIVGIDWQDLVEEFGTDKTIIYSSEVRVAETVNERGLTFIRAGGGSNEVLMRVIRKKTRNNT